MLQAIQSCEKQTASQLITLAYDELRQIAALQMRRAQDSCDLQPGDVVHEAYLRLSVQARARYRDCTHFVRVAAIVIRRVLADHRRHKLARKRTAHRMIFDQEAFEFVGRVETPYDDLIVDEAVSHLRQLDPKQADIVVLRYFDGLSVRETAQSLGISARTVKREWSLARSWLQTELSASTDRTQVHKKTLAKSLR